jgi:hypothetical protein
MARRHRSAPIPTPLSLIGSEKPDPKTIPRGPNPSQGSRGPEVTERHAQRGFPASGGGKKWWTGEN